MTLESICNIETAIYVEGIWHVRATVVTTDEDDNVVATRSGTHQVELEDTATIEDVEDAILALYE